MFVGLRLKATNQAVLVAKHSNDPQTYRIILKLKEDVGLIDICYRNGLILVFDSTLCIHKIKTTTGAYGSSEISSE